MTVSQRCEKSAHSLCAMVTCACVCHEPEAGPDSAADTVEALSKRVKALEEELARLSSVLLRYFEALGADLKEGLE